MRDPDYAIITHAMTKTSHDKATRERTVLVCTCRFGLCGLHDLRNHLRRFEQGQSSSEPLLRWSNGRRLLYADVRKFVLNICAAYGWDTTTFGTHSFRSGGATFLFSLGVPHEIICELGRWSLNSDTLQRYYIKPRQAIKARLLMEYLREGRSLLGRLSMRDNAKAKAKAKARARHGRLAKKKHGKRTADSYI
jgi:hypothetical protein